MSGVLEKITDYVSRSKDLFLEQYKEKPKFEGWQGAYDEQVQELENAFCDMLEKRTIENATGAQLDEIGLIVNQPRGGFGDTFYRRLLAAKIAENTSQGDIEKIISTANLLTGATQTHLQEHYPAGMTISVNIELDPTLVNFYYQRLNRVDSAGVRVEGVICYDPTEAFAFEGEPGPALGFGDVNDANAGGKMADFKLKTDPAFSFAAQAGVEDGDGGFGSLDDILVGGVLKSI